MSWNTDELSARIPRYVLNWMPPACRMMLPSAYQMDDRIGSVVSDISQDREESYASTKRRKKESKLMKRGGLRVQARLSYYTRG